MYKVKALKDFGVWCVKGRTYYINNNLAESLSRQGILKILKFLGNADGMSTSIYEVKRRIKYIQLQIDTLNKKKEAYEQHLKHLKKYENL